MSAPLTILITRTVHLRGRSIAAGTRLEAERLTSGSGDGWRVAHPSGIGGTYAFVPQSHATEAAPTCPTCGNPEHAPTSWCNAGTAPATFAFERERGARGW